MLYRNEAVAIPAAQATDETTDEAGRSGIERRRQVRVPLEVEVDFIHETNFYTGFADNISEGGLFVATYTPKPVGTDIDLRFTLPGGDEVRVRGQVRWLRDPRGNDVEPGMGIQFEGLDPRDEALICEFVGLRAPLFYDDE